MERLKQCGEIREMKQMNKGKEKEREIFDEEEREREETKIYDEIDR